MSSLIEWSWLIEVQQYPSEMRVVFQVSIRKNYSAHTASLFSSTVLKPETVQEMTDVATDESFAWST